MKTNSVIRISTLAMPCLAALLLSACQETPEPSSPNGPPETVSGPAKAMPGPEAVTLGEPEYAALAKSAQAAETCTIGFKDPWGLVLLPDQARNTFALPPWYSESCGGGGVRIMENPSSRYGAAWGSDYGHYHLGYQRGDFCLTPVEFKEGILTNGTCVAVAHPEQEDRYLGSHYSDHWIRLYVFGPAPIGGQGSPELTFTLKGIRVRPGADVRIYIRQVDGDWLSWSRLGPNRWGLPGASGIREVLISAASGETEPFFIDDFVVSVP